MIVQPMRCLAPSTGGLRASRSRAACIARGRSLRCVQVLRRAREHAGALGMLREGLREPHARIRRLRVPGRTLGLRQRVLLFLVGASARHSRRPPTSRPADRHRRCARIPSPRWRTGGSRTAPRPAGSWSGAESGSSGNDAEVFAIPARGDAVVVLTPGLLRLSRGNARQVLEVALQLGDDFRVVRCARGPARTPCRNCRRSRTRSCPRRRARRSRPSRRP